MRVLSKSKRYLALAMLLVIFCLSSGITVFAADVEKYQVINTKPNTWIESKSSDYDYRDGKSIYTYYRYKLTVPSTGYLEIQIKDADIYLYNRMPDPNDSDKGRIKNIWDAMGPITKIAVDKGTYYFRGYGLFKYTFKALKPAANYCIKKSSGLAAGKTVTTCMSKNNHYSRWYKIKLKKKKSITFWSNYGDQIRVYDSKHKKLDIEHAGTKSTKYYTKKQKKGTYYIRITPSLYDVITLKWS